MRTPLLLTTLLLFLPGVAAGQDTFPGIKNLMTDEQYEQAGLTKLSPTELQALDDWLIQYTATEAPALRGSNEEVKQAEAEHVIRANVKTPFTGWSGNTVFYLDNGQVWRQRLSGRVVYKGDDTAVEIKKNFMGFYKLTHLDSGRSVGVSRVK